MRGGGGDTFVDEGVGGALVITIELGQSLREVIDFLQNGHRKTVRAVGVRKSAGLPITPQYRIRVEGF